MNNEQEIREYLNQVIDDIWQNFEQYDRKDIAEMINEVYVTGVDSRNL